MVYKPQEEDVHGRTDDQLPHDNVWPPDVGEHVVVNYMIFNFPLQSLVHSPTPSL